MKIFFRYLAQILPLILIAFVIYVFMQKPRTDRNWRYNLTEVARIHETALDQYQFNNVRAFEYDLSDVFTRQEWIDLQVDASDLTEVWFFLEPFPGSDKVGHTFLSFVFENETGEREALSISVEARKEEGEEYTAINALFRRFELLYVWSTEKDILTRIGIHRDHELFAYKLNLTDDQARAIFEHFIKRTNELADKPRFYNTIHSNCTNELAKAVNTAYPGALKVRAPWIMTGRAPRWLHDMGYVSPKDTPFDTLNQTANIRRPVKAAVDLDANAFAEHWRSLFEDNAK